MTAPANMQQAVKEAARKARQSELHRIRNLPGQVERARRRVEMLEREAARRGIEV